MNIPTIRQLIEDEGAGYLKRRGVIPGHRGSSNDPYTYQSDLVEKAVERIMGNRDDLADVLQTVTAMPRPVAELLAYITAHWWSESDAVTALSRASHKAVEELVSEYCRKEADL